MLATQQKENLMIRFLTVLVTLFAATLSTPSFAHCGSCEGDKAAKEKPAECDHHLKSDAEKEKCAHAKAKAGGEGHHDKAKGEHACTSCAKGKKGEATWCEGCKVGFIDGKKVECKTCFEHKANKGEACKEHAAADGTEG